jgi:hypothetical protein
MTRYDDVMAKFGFRYVKGQKRVPTAAELKEVEAKLGSPLPDDYEEFVKEYGATAFEKSVKFPTKGPCNWGPEGTPNVFFGVLGSGSYDLLRNLDTYEGRVPAECLPIANDPGGNLVLLAVRAKNKGRVYFWDHENELEPGPDGTIGYDNTCLIADSFDAFMNSLFEKPR